MNRGKKPQDLSGQKIDMLYLQKLVVKSPYNKKAYQCLCDCGNTCIRLESSILKKNHISSCGCRSIKNLKPGNSELCSKAGLNRKKSFVNGSNIQMTFRDGTINTNTSGCQGVSWSKSAKKWHSYIGYQQYRANLGFYEDINDAIKIRHLAEDAIKNNEFEEFYYKLRGNKLQDKNTKQVKK